MNPTIQGIVLEAGDGSVLLLTESGDLQCVPWPGELPAAGTVVVGHAGKPGDGDTRLPPGLLWRRLIAAAAAAVIPLVWWLGSGRSRPVLSPLAVVAVDINPSVELRVGDEGTVLRADPQNPDGERVLAELDLAGTPAPAAAAAVVRRAAELGYLAGPEPAVLVTVVDLRPRGGSIAGSHLLEPAQFAGAVEAELRSGPPDPALVVVQQVPKAVLDEAHRRGLPVGVHTILERARSQSRPVDPTAVKTEGLHRALAAAGTSVEALYEAAAPAGDPQAPLVLRIGARGAEVQSPTPGEEGAQADRGNRGGTNREGSRPPHDGSTGDPIHRTESTPRATRPPGAPAVRQSGRARGQEIAGVPEAGEAKGSGGAAEDRRRAPSSAAGTPEVRESKEGGMRPPGREDRAPSSTDKQEEKRTGRQPGDGSEEEHEPSAPNGKSDGNARETSRDKKKDREETTTDHEEDRGTEEGEGEPEE